MNKSSPSDEIAVFIRVIERGSFAAAAVETGMTPSGVSKVVSRMEDRLGVRLLQRTTRRLALTPEGEKFLAHGRTIISAIETMEIDVTASRGRPAGLVRVSAGTVYVRRFLVPLLPEFHTCYPEIDVELSIDDRRIDVIGQQIDVAIRTGQLDNSTLATRTLGEGRRVICASRDYVKRHGLPKLPADLLSHTCLRMTTAGSLGEWWMRADTGLVPFKVKGWITVDSVDIMFDMVRQGIGIARLPGFLISNDLEAGAIVALLSDSHVAEPFPVTALMPSGRQNLPRVRAFVDFLCDRFTYQGNGTIGTGVKNGCLQRPA